MPADKHSHRRYGHSIAIAIVLSTMLVTIASLIGREAVNLQSALLAKENAPREINVIRIFQDEHADLGKVEEVVPLEKRKDQDLYPFFVRAGGEIYIVRVKNEDGIWKQQGLLEHMHEGDTINFKS